MDFLHVVYYFPGRMACQLFPVMSFQPTRVWDSLTWLWLSAIVIILNDGNLTLITSAIMADTNQASIPSYNWLQARTLREDHCSTHEELDSEALEVIS